MNHIRTELLTLTSCSKCFDILSTYLFIYSMSQIKEEGPHLALVYRLSPEIILNDVLSIPL